MEAKAINMLIKEYDEYLNSLRHISYLGLNDKKIQESGSNVNARDVEEYLSPQINAAHQHFINQLINPMIGKTIDFNGVRDIKNFICYPDFSVKTQVKNPANIYKNRLSIEQTVYIAPTYELNLKLDIDCKEFSRDASIVRIKRLELGPSINVFSLIEDEIDNYILEGGMKDMIRRFREKFGSEPTANDLVLLRNIAIKYILERVRKSGENDLTCLFKDDAYLSYDYRASKNNICNKYKVDFDDKYASVSPISSPWIFRGLEYFDNRVMVKKNDEDTIVPLIYQRTKK